MHASPDDIILLLCLLLQHPDETEPPVENLTQLYPLYRSDVRRGIGQYLQQLSRQLIACQLDRVSARPPDPLQVRLNRTLLQLLDLLQGKPLQQAA